MTRGRPGALEAAWAVLVLATLASYVTGSGGGDVAAAVVLVVAFVKVRIIGSHFMELATAPAALTRAFDAYVGVVATALVTLYFTL